MTAPGVQLTPVEFGRQLVVTGDLDPIYMMLRSAELPLAIRQRWSLAYWLFYHAGVATKVASAPSNKFWSVVQQGLDDKWPRGTERRHFRGKQAQTTVDNLRYDGHIRSAEELVQYISGEPGTTHKFLDVKARALSWWGFGEWISFKMADMSDAVLDVTVDFTGTEAHFFDAPKKGARLVLRDALGWELDDVAQSEVRDEAAVSAAINDVLLPELAALRAPHAPERPLALQEYETILCKYKSHLSGHYPVGYDTHHIMRALEWDGSPLALKLTKALSSGL